MPVLPCAPLCAALCLGSGEYTLGGEPRMEERPIGHLVDALREAGAHIQYLKKDGYPPWWWMPKGSGVAMSTSTAPSPASS